MTTADIAAALDRIAHGFHDLSVTVAAGADLRADLLQPAPVRNNQTEQRCQCGGAVTFQQWTSKAGKHCRAHKCERSKVGEDHFIEWAS